MSEINNITDQIQGFTDEVVEAIKRVESQGFTREEAIKIVELGIKDMGVEVSHHKNKKLESISEALYAIAKELPDYEE